MYNIENSHTDELFSQLVTIGIVATEKQAEEHIAEKQRLVELFNSIGIKSNIALTQLVCMSFKQAKDYIQKLSITDRLLYLDKLDDYLLYLYQATKRYSAGESVPKEMQISSKEFQIILSKIKRLEIMQNWLFGID